MSFAPPIARDGFHYNGDLYVEVGNLNRHKRASIAEIKAILRPDLKQPKATTAVPPTKDPVGHWYEAQLIHYGLPPSKDKARAKMRLLEALNTSNLAVPAGIARLETQLKKDYAAADRKAKAQYKAEVAPSGKNESTTTSKKRKQSEPTNSINVNINFGPYAGAYGGQQPQTTPNFLAGNNETYVSHTDSPANKKSKSATTANSKKPSVPRQDNSQSSSRKEPKAKATPATKRLTTGEDLNDKPSKPVRPIQTARWSGPTKQGSNSPAPKKQSITKKEASVKDEPAFTTATPARPKQTARRSVPPKREPVPKKEPAMKKEPSIKRESSVQNEMHHSRQPKLGLINGFYEIFCPALENEWSGYGDDMSLILCLDSPGVWGAYDFGMFSGILHLGERPWEPSDEPIPCTWRGRENSEGQMSFGDSCVGEITFLGDGRIEGYLNMYGECQFNGARVPGPGSAPRTAASMKQEWNGYDSWAYEEEARNRWR